MTFFTALCGGRSWRLTMIVLGFFFSSANLLLAQTETNTGIPGPGEISIALTNAPATNSPPVPSVVAPSPDTINAPPPNSRDEIGHGRATDRLCLVWFLHHPGPERLPVDPWRVDDAGLPRRLFALPMRPDPGEKLRPYLDLAVGGGAFRADRLLDRRVRGANGRRRGRSCGAGPTARAGGKERA